MMNNFEKTYSVLAVAFALCLVTGIILFPELRRLNFLLPMSFLGLAVNIGLLFLVLRDIFLRRFSNKSARFYWLGLVLIFWPSIIYYLLHHGFRPRRDQDRPVLNTKES
jgi:hypothetical protein